MEAEIHPETKVPDKPAATGKIGDNSLPLESEPESNTASLLIETSQDNHSGRMKKTLFFLALALIAIAIATAFVTLPKSDEPMLIGIHEQCKIYTFDGNEHGIEQLNGAQEMLAAEEVDCTKQGRDIYYMEARPTNKLLKVKFMAACTKNGNSSYKNCNNYKLVE